MIDPAPVIALDWAGRTLVTVLASVTVQAMETVPESELAIAPESATATTSSSTVPVVTTTLSLATGLGVLVADTGAVDPAVRTDLATGRDPALAGDITVVGAIIGTVAT